MGSAAFSRILGSPDQPPTGAQGFPLASGHPSRAHRLREVPVRATTCGDGPSRPTVSAEGVPVAGCGSVSGTLRVPIPCGMPRADAPDRVNGTPKPFLLRDRPGRTDAHRHPHARGEDRRPRRQVWSRPSSRQPSRTRAKPGAHGPASRGVHRCSAPALPRRVIRVLGATTGRDWLVRPGTRSVPEVRAAHSACKAAAARVRW